MTTPATITSVRTSPGNIFLSPKADASAPSPSSLYKYFCIINELHLKIKKADDICLFAPPENRTYY
jgi:hypothetical protein